MMQMNADSISFIRILRGSIFKSKDAIWLFNGLNNNGYIKTQQKFYRQSTNKALAMGVMYSLYFRLEIS